MRNRIQSLCSFIVVVLFGFGALASLGADEATNTSVPISNCKGKPVKNGSASVKLFYHQKNGEPIANAPGIAFITHQEVTDTVACTFTSSSPLTQDIFTGADGKFTLDVLHFSHDNSEDLYRVEILMNRTAFHDETRKTLVHKYDVANFNFDLVGLRLDGL